MASHATATALIPSPIADTADAGNRRRGTGLAMTKEISAGNSAAGMAFPSPGDCCGHRRAWPPGNFLGRAAWLERCGLPREPVRVREGPRIAANDDPVRASAV